MIWNRATTVHDTITNIILQVIGESVTSLSKDHLIHLISLMKQVPRSQLTNNYLNCIREMIKNSFDTDVKTTLMQFLWDLVIDENQNPKQSCSLLIRQQALQTLQDVTKFASFRSMRSEWVKQIILAAKEKQNCIPFCYDFLISVLSTVQIEGDKSGKCRREKERERKREKERERKRGRWR